MHTHLQQQTNTVLLRNSLKLKKKKQQPNFHWYSMICSPLEYHRAMRTIIKACLILLHFALNCVSQWHTVLLCVIFHKGRFVVTLRRTRQWVPFSPTAFACSVSLCLLLVIPTIFQTLLSYLWQSSGIYDYDSLKV